MDKVRRIVVLLSLMFGVQVYANNKVDDMRDNQISLGVSLGSPAIINVVSLFRFNYYAVRLSGAYWGSEQHSPLMNGAQIEVMRTIHSASVTHSLDMFFGHQTVGHSASNQLNYFGLGYDLTWKGAFVQLGLSHVFNSYSDARDPFPTFKIGYAFSLH